MQVGGHMKVSWFDEGGIVPGFKVPNERQQCKTKLPDNGNLENKAKTLVRILLFKLLPTMATWT